MNFILGCIFLGLCAATAGSGASPVFAFLAALFIVGDLAGDRGR